MKWLEAHAWLATWVTLWIVVALIAWAVTR